MEDNITMTPEITQEPSLEPANDAIVATDATPFTYDEDWDAFDALPFPDSLDDVFRYADILSVRETASDVRLEAVVRKTGKRVFMTGDDLEDVLNKTMRLIEDDVWLIEDICDFYEVTPDYLRAALGDFDALDRYEAGYEEGWTDAIHQNDDAVKAEAFIKTVESQSYDEGYLAGLHDSGNDIERALDEEWNAGWELGWELGYEAGGDDGWEKAYDTGFDEAFLKIDSMLDEAWDAGHSLGYDRGYFDGADDAYRWATTGEDPDAIRDYLDDWDDFEDLDAPAALGDLFASDYDRDDELEDLPFLPDYVAAINPALVAAAQPFEEDSESLASDEE